MSVVQCLVSWFPSGTKKTKKTSRDDKHVIDFLYWHGRPVSPCSNAHLHRAVFHMAEYALMCFLSLPYSLLISTLVVYSVIFETASLKPRCASVVQEHRSQTSSLQRGNEFLRPLARLMYLRTWNRGRNMLILTLSPGYVSAFQVSESD